MNTAPPDETLPASAPHDNPNPATGHSDDGDGANGNGNGGGGRSPPDCPDIVDELRERLLDIDALSEAAQHFIDAVPRIGSPEGERAFTRLTRIVEQLARAADSALEYAAYGAEIVRTHGGDA